MLRGAAARWREPTLAAAMAAADVFKKLRREVKFMIEILRGKAVLIP
jgi:hypothetical protein